MANYDAQINILVAGQRNIENLANQLTAIEDSIGQIERRWRTASAALQRTQVRLNVIGTQQPRSPGGRFAADPDRQARFAALADQRRARVEQQLTRLSLRRTSAEAARARSQIDDNQTLLRQTERRISLESRLNAANELFQRRGQQFQRGGAGRNLPQQLRDQARSIEAAYEAAGGAASRNLRLVRDLSNEYGKLVERQNEFNRQRSLASKGFEAGRRLQERIDVVGERGGVSGRRIRELRSRAEDVIATSQSGDQQAYSEALRRAAAAVGRVERESNRVARETRRIAGLAPRSPVAGGVNFPGSPRALEAQRRAESAALEASKRGYPSSPIAGSATMLGSPRYLAAQEKARAAAERAVKAQERAAKIAEKTANSEADRILKASQKGFPSSPIAGTPAMVGSPRFLAAQEKARLAAERALAAQERASKASQTAADRALKESQKGFPASPIRGTATMAGSPAFLAAEQRRRTAAERAVKAQQAAQDRAARIQERANAASERAAEKALKDAQQGYPSSPIRGGASMVGSPAFLAMEGRNRAAAERRLKAQQAAEDRVARARDRAAAAAERAADKALKEAQKGYPSSPVLGSAAIEGSPRWRTAQEIAQRKLELAARATERAADKAIKDAQKGFPSSPIRGTATMVGSPRFLEAQERAARTAAGVGSPVKLEERRSRLLENAFRLQSQIQSLESKGGSLSSEKLSLEQRILEIKNLQGKATQDEIAALSTGLQEIRTSVQGVRTGLQGAGGSGAAVKESGFAKSFKSFSEGLGDVGGFFGDLSPAQAIDKIVREFNAGLKPKGGAGKNVVDTLLGETKAGLPKAAKAGSDLGKAVEDGLNNGLDIASPSGVAERAMRNVIQTLVSVAKSGRAAVQAALRELIEPDLGAPKLSAAAASSPTFAPTAVVSASRVSAPQGGIVLGPAGATPASQSGIFNPSTRRPDLGGTGSAYPNLPAYNLADELSEAGRRVATANNRVREAIKQYRTAVENFWEGQDSEFVSAGKVVASFTRLAAARISRRLQQKPDPSIDQQISRELKEARGKLPLGAGVRSQLSSLAEKAGKKLDSVFSAISLQVNKYLDRIKSVVASRQPPAPPAQAVESSGFLAASRRFTEITEATRAGAPIPPVPPRRPGAPSAGGPDDFSARLSAAADQGAQALLGLKELQDPSKVASARLEQLAAILKTVAANIDPVDDASRRLIKQINKTEVKLADVASRRAPDADFFTRRFGERGGRAISEGLIGGAFPLLFGQGVGAAVGGGVGGAAGGFMGGGFGFGLSLIGTALGTAFDTFNNNLKELASSLKDPTSSLEAMKTAGLRVTPELEYLVQKLDSSGRAAEAQRKVFEELERQLGAGMVGQLQALNSEQKELERQWQQLSATLTTALLPAITGTIAIVNDTINSFKSLSSVKLPPWLSKTLGLATEAQMGIGSIATPGFGLSRFFLQNAISRGREEAKKQAGGGDTLTPQKQEEALRAQIQKAQEIRSLQQQGADIQRSAAELRLSIEDTIYGFRRRAEDMARESVQFRRSVEDEIFNKRQGLEQKLIENERKRQQNAIDALDLQLQRAATELDPVAQGVVDAARQYLRIRAEGEADLQQTEQQVKLELQRIDQETSRYKLQAEERIAQMVTQREEFARDVSRARTQAEYQVQDYIIKVEQYRVEMAQKRVDLALQEGKILDASAIAERTGLSTGGQSVATIASRNKTPLEKALLATIRFAEGTAGPQGYRTMFGGGLFSDMSRHPNKVVRSGGYASAAAGAYQFLPGTWAATGGGAMTPERQDAAAIYLAQRRGVDINRMGFTPQVASMLAPEWASFPTMKGGSFYGQPAKTYQQLRAYFDRALAEYSKQKPTGGDEWGFSIPAGFPGAQAPVDKYGLTVGAQAAPTSQSASAAPGIGTFVGGGRASIASAQSMASDMSMPIPPSPPSLPQWPGAPELIQVNDLMERYVELQVKLKSAIEAATGIERQRLQIQSEAARLAFEQQTLAPIRQFIEQNRELEFEIQKRKTRNRLLSEGVKPEIIEGELRVLEINRNLESVLQGLEVQTNAAINAELTRLGLTNRLVDSTFNLTEATLAKLIADTEDLKKQEKLRQELQKILDLKNKIAGDARTAAGTAASGARDIASQEAAPGEKIRSFIAEATAELNDLESVAIRVSQGIGDALGSSVSDAITGLTAGTASAKQLFASFLADIGQILVREATKMIATYVAIGVARIFAGFASSGSSSIPSTGNPAAPTIDGLDTGFISNLAADGAYFDYGIAKFANGGMFANSIVSSPTLFQFADGGALKAGVMGEAGPEAIMPLERGPDGRLGVSAIGMREALAAARSALPAGGQSGGDSAFAENREALGAVSSLERERLIERVLTSGAGSSEIKYSRVDSGDLPFVTEEDMLQASRLAAQEGARLGQQRTLAALKNNPAARRTVGM